MMYRFIKMAAQSFEDKAPQECIVGIKISTVSVIAAFIGGAIAFGINEIAGKIIVFIAIISNFYGLALYFSGYIKKIKRDREVDKVIREKYENPKQPWE